MVPSSSFWYKMPVHDIHMDPARSSRPASAICSPRRGKICRKNGWGNQEAFRHYFQTCKRLCARLVHRMGGLYTKYTHNQNGTRPKHGDQLPADPGQPKPSQSPDSGKICHMPGSWWLRETASGVREKRWRRFSISKVQQDTSELICRTVALGRYFGKDFRQDLLQNGGNIREYLGDWHRLGFDMQMGQFCSGISMKRHRSGQHLIHDDAQ